MPCTLRTNNHRSVYSCVDKSSINGVTRCGMIKTWPGTMGRKLTKAALSGVRAKMLAWGITNLPKRMSPASVDVDDGSSVLAAEESEGGGCGLVMENAKVKATSRRSYW
ncbi:MAG: hypothetical protein SGARI_003917 [Bacillariaceae sp.]